MDNMEAAAREENSFVWKLEIKMNGYQFKCINGFRFPYLRIMME
jgi:hypothetical protein